ncbi:MAG: oligosaccharide flippase family protein [Chitinophagales bacterium]
MRRLPDLSALARRRPVVASAAALALTAGVARLFDASYRMVVARLVGPETVGLLQMAGSVYSFALGLATLGLAPALARLVAARRAEEPAVTTARLLAMPAGIGSALLLLAAAPWLAGRALPDPRVLRPLQILAFGLIPAAYCATLRGQLQGTQRMAPLAWSQVVEPLVRLTLVSLLLAGASSLWSVPLPLPPAALLAIAGVVAEGVECLFLHTWLTRAARGARRPKAPSPAPAFSPPVARELLRLAVPLMISQFVFSTVAMLDAGLVPRLLAASGLSAPEATRQYGMLYGMVLPFLFFPMTLIFPITAVLIPAVAEAREAGRHGLVRKRIGLAVRATLLVEAGAALVYLLWPHRLAALVGGGSEVTALIRGLLLWVPFAYLDHTGVSALIGLGNTRAALVDGLLNSAVRLGVSCLLVPVPGFGVRGALVALAAGDAVATFAHFLRLAPLRRRPAR